MTEIDGWTERKIIQTTAIIEKAASNVIMMSDLLNEDIPEIEWLIENIIPEKGITILGGDVGSLKTYFALYSAICCSVGAPLFGYKTKKIKILYIDEENRKRTIRSRSIKLLKGLGLDYDVDVGFLISKDVKLDNPDWSKRIEEVIQELQPELVIVDSMIRVMLGDENESKCVKRIFQTIKPLIELYNTSWLLIHHTRKTKYSKGKDDLRGSSDFSAFADVVMMINKNSSNCYTLTQAKNRHSEPIESIRINVIDKANGGLSFECSKGGVKELLSVSEKCSYDIMGWIRENQIVVFETKEVMAVATSEYKENSVYTALRLLANRGIIRKAGFGRYEAVGGDTFL